MTLDQGPVELHISLRVPDLSTAVIGASLIVPSADGASRQVLAHERQVLIDPLAWPRGVDADETEQSSGPVPDWGLFVEEIVSRGVGDRVFADVVRIARARPNTSQRDGDVDLRIVFSPGGSIARSIPFERFGPDALSIVQIPERVDETRSWSGTRRAGCFRSLVAMGADHANDLSIDRFAELGLAETGPNDAFRSTGRCKPMFASEVRRSLAERVSSDLPCVLVLCGHGEISARDGTWGWDVGGDDPMTSAALAHSLRGLAPGVAVLAMCLSASTAAGGGFSACERAIQAGVPLVIGFRGRPSPQIVLRFLETFLASVDESFGSEDGTSPQVSLLTWERAALRGRRVMAGEGATLHPPVLLAHPGLLTGTDVFVRPQWTRRRPQLVRARTKGLVTPWYVPGQVTTGSTERGPYRVPLPVDVGARMLVELTAAPRSDVVARGPLEPELRASDIVAIRERWPALRGRTPYVEIYSGNKVVGWANRAAEMSAVVRALAELLDEHPPSEVVRLIHEIVAASWGTTDAAPRALDVGSGECVRRFDRWPRGIVKDLSKQAPRSDLERARPEIFAPAEPDAITSIQLALDGDAATLRSVIEDQQRAVRKVSRLSETLKGISARREPVVLLPAAASLDLTGTGARAPVLFRVKTPEVGSAAVLVPDVSEALGIDVTGRPPVAARARADRPRSSC